MGASLTVLLRLPFYYLQQLLVVQARFLRVNALAGSADAKRRQCCEECEKKAAYIKFLEYQIERLKRKGGVYEAGRSSSSMLDSASTCSTAVTDNQSYFAEEVVEEEEEYANHARSNMPVQTALYWAFHPAREKLVDQVSTCQRFKG